MPGTNGLVLAQTVRSMSKPPAVVFVTAHAMYAANAFELEATDYLTKPVRLERLQQTLAKIRRIRALEGLGDATDHLPALVIRDRGRAERVPLHQIIYFKAEQKYVTVRTASRTYIYDNSLSELENRFPASSCAFTAMHWWRHHRCARWTSTTPMTTWNAGCCACTACQRHCRCRAASSHLCAMCCTT